MAQRWRLILIALSLLSAGAVAVFWAGNIAARTPPSAESAFQDSSACRRCHPKFYELWSSSHHGLAMQPFTGEFARRNPKMDQAPVRVGEVTYAPEPDAQGGSIVERSSTATRRYRLE